MLLLAYPHEATMKIIALPMIAAALLFWAWPVIATLAVAFVNFLDTVGRPTFQTVARVRHIEHHPYNELTALDSDGAPVRIPQFWQVALELDGQTHYHEARIEPTYKIGDVIPVTHCLGRFTKATNGVAPAT